MEALMAGSPPVCTTLVLTVPTAAQRSTCHCKSLGVYGHFGPKTLRT